MKRGIAGSMESNDALITVKESDKLSVTVKSIVYDFFHEQIEKVIYDTLAERGIGNVEVIDYTIKARLLTALDRMEG